MNATDSATTSHQPIVHSLYWGNISTKIVNTQKKVFDHLGIELKQQLLHRQNHGQWMNSIVDKSASEDIIIFCDIDAFPLSRSSFEEAVQFAEEGFIYGLAQVANHLKNSLHIYAGPMFLCFKKTTWIAAGSPCLKGSEQYDAGQNLTLEAEKKGIKIKLIYPTTTISPKWPLANNGVFGIGTFYEQKFFHLFESRSDKNAELLKMVGEDICLGKNLDFKSYLEFIRSSSPKPKKSLKLHAKARTVLRLIVYKINEAKQCLGWLKL